MHLERSSANGGFNLGQKAAMVDRAQRMQTPLGFGNDSIGGTAQKPPQQVHGDLRHVARDKQDAVSSCGFKGREQASQRATIRDDVRDYSQAEVGVSRVADHCCAASGLTNDVRDLFQKGSTTPRQQPLIPAHARATAAGQHESRGSKHEKKVAMPARNRIAICLGLTLLALAPLHAENSGARKLVVRADRKTGRLVTVPVVVTKPVYRAPAANIAQMVADAAKANDIDPLLVHSVIQVESNYNPYAVSSAGARGLMQLMPGTAKELGVKDSFDPRQNIEAGVKYLKKLKDQYQDDKLALAAYNAGPGSVQKYKSVPPYPETMDYVQRVGERYVEARKVAGIAPAVALQPEIPQAVPQAPAVLEVPTEEKHAKLEQFLDEYGRLHLRTVPE